MLELDPGLRYSQIFSRKVLLAGISSAALALSGCGGNSSPSTNGLTETAPPALEGSSVPQTAPEASIPRVEGQESSRIAAQLGIAKEQLPPLLVLGESGPIRILKSKETVSSVRRASIEQLFFVIDAYVSQENPHHIKLPGNNSQRTIDYNIELNNSHRQNIIIAEPGDFGEGRSWSTLNKHPDVGVIVDSGRKSERLANEITSTFLRVMTAINTKSGEDRRLILNSLIFAFRKAMGGTEYEDYVASVTHKKNKVLAGIERLGIVSPRDFDVIFLAGQGLRFEDAPDDNRPTAPPNLS